MPDAARTSQSATKDDFLKLLGDFPTPPPLNLKVLETEKLQNGLRHKIEYTVEEPNTIFNRPEDKVRAYLFEPKRNGGQKFPAIVAIHQDGPHRHLGKLEPAGLDGDKDQFYGIELFNRGYAVICPDRIGHAERRPEVETDDDLMKVIEHRSGQFILEGRTNVGKETYDLIRATDVLCSMDYVDSERVGAIGHSAGGYALVYFMFADERIRVGVSSCGFFELINWYHEPAPMYRGSSAAIPGLAKIGKAADYLAYIAPRPFLMTRGLWEWGTEQEWKNWSEAHVAETKEIHDHALQRYRKLNSEDHLKVIYFDENNGWHLFPPKVKEQSFDFIDQFLKPKDKRQ
jgi:dienelactone hydrolase